MKQERKRKRVFLEAFFISLGLLFLAAGGVVSYMVSLQKQEARPQGADARAYPYDADEALNVLVMGTPEKGQCADLFLLIRYAPQEGEIRICGLPAELTATVNIKTGSLSELFDYGGDGYVIGAVQNVFQIPIDRRVRLTDRAAATLIDSLGGVVYSLTDEVRYQDPKTAGTLILAPGRQTLDGRRVIAAGRGEYEKDCVYRAGVYANVIRTLVNQKLTAAFFPKLERLYQSFLEVASTDFSAYDYAYRSDGILYLLENHPSPARAVPVTGAIDDDGYFSPDAETKRLIFEKFAGAQEEAAGRDAR